jgi:hypothetical protein
VGRLLQIGCRLGVSIASHSTDVGRLIRSHVNLIGIDILCKKQRDLAISDQAVEFSIFGIPFAAWVGPFVVIAVLCLPLSRSITALRAVRGEPMSAHSPERWPSWNQPTLQKAMRLGNS